MRHKTADRRTRFCAAAAGIYGREKTVHWHNIEFCLVGEATARTLKTKLGSLDLTNFCAVYVEIGTNGQQPLQLLF